MLGLESVREYYGKVLKTSKDLQTSACCTTESMPNYLKPLLKMVHEEVQEKFYGCGSPIPLGLEGCSVLDLGSGSGRDCYLLSKLVGPNGRVIGIDMTAEQLAVARKHIDYHTQQFGYSTPNVNFREGFIEDLAALDVRDNSIDVVTSNCVINLSPDKTRVFKEVFRVLKPGGEFYFSDVFASRRVPKHLAEDDVFIGECLGGALYTEDFRRILNTIGCADFRVMSKTKIDLNNLKLQERAGSLEFYSITVRAFKLDLEDRCEDYGQMAIYKGTLPQSPLGFRLDDHHLFETGKPMPVCGNTADMLSRTRFKDHFTVTAHTGIHFGLFDCGPTTAAQNSAAAAACC